VSSHQDFNVVPFAVEAPSLALSPRKSGHASRGHDDLRGFVLRSERKAAAARVGHGDEIGAGIGARYGADTEEEELMIELTVEDVLARISADSDTRLDLPVDPAKLAWHGRIILLKERDAERVFPIWTGAFEGDMLAIALRIQEGSTTLAGATSPPRPMTHDLMTELIRVMGGHVQQVAITSLRDITYYATVSLTVNGHTEKVDARPSDAILLAARTRARRSS